MCPRRLGFSAVVVAALAAAAAHAALVTREVTTMAGQAAPAIEEKSVQGAPVDTATARGKVLLVNFFASWCPGFPATYVVNPEGKFVKALYGYHPPAKLAAGVNALLPKSASR